MIIAVVHWIDAHTIDEWTGLEDIKKQGLSECKSVGILLYEDKEKVIITHTVGETDSCGNIVIPKRFIKAFNKREVKL